MPLMSKFQSHLLYVRHHKGQNILKKKLLEKKEMVFKNGLKDIQFYAWLWCTEFCKTQNLCNIHWTAGQKCKHVSKSSPDEILEKCNFVQCGFLACVPLCLGRGLLKVQKKGSSSTVQLCHNCQFLSQKNGQSCINGNVDRIKCNHSMAHI